MDPLRGAGGDSIRGRVDAREFASFGEKAIILINGKTN
jgi:hypothetical protein